MSSHGNRPSWKQTIFTLSLLCLFRYKPSREVGTFHENSSRLRAHGVQRCLHLPYVPAAGFGFAGEHGREAAWRGTSNSGHEDCLGVKSELPSLASAVFLPLLFSVAWPQLRPCLSRGPGSAAHVGRDSAAALGFLGSTSKTAPLVHILVFIVYGAERTG